MLKIVLNIKKKNFKSDKASELLNREHLLFLQSLVVDVSRWTVFTPPSNRGSTFSLVHVGQSQNTFERGFVIFLS